MPAEAPLQPDNAAVLEAEFEMTVEDVLAFNVYHNAHSPAVRRAYQLILLLFLLMALMLCLLIAGHPTAVVPIGILVLYILGFGLFVQSQPYRRWRVRRWVAKLLREGGNKSMLGHQKVSLNREGLTQTNPCGLTQTKWFGVERVVVTDDHAFIYLSAISASVIPKRAFPGDADFNRFVEQARRFLDQAKSGPAASANWSAR